MLPAPLEPQRSSSNVVRLTLWRQTAIDVLVETAVARTLVARQSARWQQCSALKHVGAIVVITARFALIDPGHSILPVGPHAEREATQRADPKVIAGEGHGAPAELLVVGVA